MNNNELVPYENPTPIDLEFMHSHPCAFPSINSSLTLTSTRPDTQSAPLELAHLFNSICEKAQSCIETEI